MFNFIKEIKEVRNLKKQQLMYSTALLMKLYDFVDGIPDITEMAKKAKDLNGAEFQKMIVEEIVKYVEANKDKADADKVEE